MNLPITVSDRDALRLRQLIQAGERANTENISRLKAELGRAHVVPAAKLPANVVALNSTVECQDLGDGEIMTYTLVLPQHADAASGKISILAPLAIALLGFKVGDVFEWPVPGGALRIRIQRLITATEPALLAQLRS